ncbi:hypothetical protein AOLI_G00051590 [Acnodon oligacanthus]
MRRNAGPSAVWPQSNQRWTELELGYSTFYTLLSCNCLYGCILDTRLCSARLLEFIDPQLSFKMQRNGRAPCRRESSYCTI